VEGVAANVPAEQPNAADYVTVRELEAIVRELKTRTWIVAGASLLGSFIGGSVKAGLSPHEAAEMLWRLL
jgi:hypothetical protein